MSITPEQQAWLDFCRAQRRDLTPEAFNALVPEFLRLMSTLKREKRIGKRH
jgi:hypothetical protein